MTAVDDARRRLEAAARLAADSGTPSPERIALGDRAADYAEAIRDYYPDATSDEVYTAVALATLDGITQPPTLDPETERLRDILDRHPATQALAAAMLDSLDRLEAADPDTIARAFEFPPHD